jgi:predicted RNase H-like HicB family nuclease
MLQITSWPPVDLELIPDPEQGGFTAHILDISVYGEGETEEEATEDLRVGLKAYIEEFSLEEALSHLNLPSIFQKIALNKFLNG